MPSRGWGCSMTHFWEISTCAKSEEIETSQHYCSRKAKMEKYVDGRFRKCVSIFNVDMLSRQRSPQQQPRCPDRTSFSLLWVDVTKGYIPTFKKSCLLLLADMLRKAAMLVRVTIVVIECKNLIKP